jgi:DNA repair protein RadC
MTGRATNDDELLTGGHRARLRKRLLDAGPAGILDHELVEYLLALTIPRVDTKPLAKRLLHDFGGIGQLLGASTDTLRREGLTDPTIAALKIAEASALRLLESRIERGPVLSSWDALEAYLHAAMAHKRVEEVRILFLNAKNKLLANEALWQGSVDEASVHVREGKNLKGRMLAMVVGMVGTGAVQHGFRKTVTAMEARNQSQPQLQVSRS